MCDSDSDSDSVSFKSKGEPYLDAVVMYLPFTHPEPTPTRTVVLPGTHQYSVKWRVM